MATHSHSLTLRGSSCQSQPLAPVPRLSLKETRVLWCTAEGYETAETAALLDVQPETVKSHRSKIMHKLGVRNMAQAIDRCYRLGILTQQNVAMRQIFITRRIAEQQDRALQVA